MKKIFILIVSIWQLQTISAQCIVDAGPDVSMCVDIWSKIDSVQLHPTVNGTVGKVSYEWNFKYNFGLNIYSWGSYLLTDTAAKNPYFVFCDGPENNTWYPMYLIVRDSIGNTCTDSFMFRVSQYSLLLDFLERNIKKGDTVQLYPIAGRAIPPLSYQWSPNYRINDTIIAEPIAYPDKNMVYSCKVTDSIGCVSGFTGTEWYIWVDTLSGIPDIPISVASIYPNPITETSILYFNQIGNYSIAIYNEIGQLQHQHYSIGNSFYPLKNIIVNSGVYYIVIIENDKILGKIRVLSE